MSDIKTALSSALAPTVNHGTTYFDPTDMLQDKLSHEPALYARVMDSMAWMLDNSCIGQARTVLFGRYAEVDHTSPTAFADFCQGVAEELQHDSLYADGTPEEVLAILMSLRNNWHDAAAAAAATNDRDYQSKSLRQLMEAEEVRQADVGTRTNFKLLAKQQAEGDEAKELRLYTAYMEADAIASQQRVDNNKALMPTILEVLRAGNMHAQDTYRFDHLPLNVQRRLTTFAVGAIDRTKMDLAKRMSRQPLEYANMLEAAFACTKALEAVIVSKYSDAGELENTGSTQREIDHGRAAKRAACSID